VAEVQPQAAEAVRGHLLAEAQDTGSKKIQKSRSFSESAFQLPGLFKSKIYKNTRYQ
jgi:hypothetical protein